MRPGPIALAILTSIASACSGGGGGGSDSPGGFVRVEHRLTSGGVEATFARAELTDVRESLPSRGRCAVPEPASGEGTWRDVGDTITLFPDGDGADPIVLTRATLGSLVVYGADGLPASASPAGATFDVTLSGNEEVAPRTWEDGIEVPALLEPGDFVNEIGFNVEQTFTWTPVSGLDDLFLEISSAGQVDLLCRAKGSAGELVIPAAQNTELAASGGTVTWRAVLRSDESLDGDTVALEGSSAVVVPYQ